MKTKERIMKILSWWLIISMVMQMVPFSVISVFAEDPSKPENTVLNAGSDETSESGQSTGNDQTSGQDTGSGFGQETPSNQDADDGETTSQTIAGETKTQYPITVGSDDPIYYSEGETYTLTALPDGYQWQDAAGNLYAPGDTITVNSDLSFTAVEKPVVRSVKSAPEDTTEGTDEETVFFTVTFYNRDAQVIKTLRIPSGDSIGDKLPGTIDRTHYNAFWAVGSLVDGGQGKEISVTGPRIDGTYVPTDDVTVVPDYEKITHTVTFYNEPKKQSVLETQTVDYETNYGVNNMPAVPEMDGYLGKWVYSGGDFTNAVSASDSDIDVWPKYEQNIFTVTYKIGDDETPYQEETYNKGALLELPDDPVVKGKTFESWINEKGEIVAAGTTVTSDMILTAKFVDEYTVTFQYKVEGEGGTEETVNVLSTFIRTAGEPIGQLPEEPYLSGKIFEKWVDETGTEVTAETKVAGAMVVTAVFRDVEIYTITAEYYYNDKNDERYVFNTEVIEVEAKNLPYTITAPASKQTEEDKVVGHPLYYPLTPTLKVEASKFDADRKCSVSFQYVDHTADYDFVYLLKDLNCDGYTEIPGTRVHVEGVKDSYVTPTVKTFAYANLELAEGATITEKVGQELKVYYTRKNFQLTYETNGGTYVPGDTYPYGTELYAATERPTRPGYTFKGWYADPDFNEGIYVIGTYTDWWDTYEYEEKNEQITIEKDTILYAKWEADTVKYTIVYMFEKYNDAGTESSYVYDNSREASATTDSTVQASSAPTIYRKGWEKDTERNATSSVKVAADGSSVLYVYYKLTGYTFYFRPGKYSNRDVTASLNGQSRTGNNNYSYSFTAKIGQDISSKWISAGNGTYKNNNNKTRNVYFSGWVKTSGGDVYVTKRLLLTEDMLPSSGTSITYEGYWLSDTVTYTVNYMLQNADNDGYTRSEKYSQTYSYSENATLNPKDIAGFTYVSRTDSGRTANLYYNRDTFNIDFYYGSTKLDTIEM